MADVAATADMLGSGCSTSFFAKIALVIAALASASRAAALIADFDPITWNAESASKEIITASFDARFFPGSAPDLPSTHYPVPLVQSLPSELEIKFQEARGRLAQRLQTQGWQADLTEQSKSSVATVPLPRSRPVEADLNSKNAPATAQQDNRTLLQKLSDLLPARNDGGGTILAFDDLFSRAVLPEIGTQSRFQDGLSLAPVGAVSFGEGSKLPARSARASMVQR
jgi:hypothetical protein